MSNEQWLSGGDCNKCRRCNYCSKPCKPNQSRRSMYASLCMVKSISKFTRGQSDYLEPVVDGVLSGAFSKDKSKRFDE